MNQRWVMGAILVLGACQGETATTFDELSPDPDPVILRLLTDSKQALYFENCPEAAEGEACRKYPNAMGCKTMTLTIERGEGMTYECLDADGEILFSGFVSSRAGIFHGLPVQCAANSDQTCIACRDTFGEMIAGTCPDGEDPFESSPIPAHNPPDEDDEPTPPAEPPACSIRGVLAMSLEQTNKVLEEVRIDGRLSSWTELSPFFPRLNVRLGNRFPYEEGASTSWEAFVNNPHQTTLDSLAHRLGFSVDELAARLEWLEQQYDYDSSDQLSELCHRGGSCQCAAIGQAAQRRVVTHFPENCQATNPRATAVIIATLLGHFFPFWLDGQTVRDVELICTASPLVLDLKNNGIAPTSLASGVSFDLLGNSASLRTAWVQGDDALLVRDCNKNGIIDSGRELFGQGTQVGNLPAHDGFQALAALDQKAEGGNSDGLVNAKDKRFHELQLWRDANGDGISQSSELSTLGSSGIHELNTHPVVSGRSFDTHGNDLSMRGNFLRSDGSRGLMIDVFFVTGP